jgi:O-antigen ligase
VCVTALGCALVAQSILGTMEVVTKRSGVLGLLGLGSAEEMAVLGEQSTPERFYGWWRATGTMNHPPNLASYMLLTIPLLLALGLSLYRGVPRVLAALGGLAGLVGLACTLTRWPWALAALQAALLVVGLARLRVLRLKQAIAIFAIAVCVGTAVLVPFKDAIMDRMTRDFARSVDERSKGVHAGISMFTDNNPFLGVGLNNYKVHMLTYQPEAEWTLQHEDLSVRLFHLRFLVGPWNGFVFVLAETGLLGLCAFLVYLVGAFAAGARAIAATDGPARAASFGIVLGLVGVLGHQLTDYSLFVDPVLYTFALMVGMLNNAPVLAEDTGARRDPIRTA